jgi:hypothetical protein
MRLKVDENLPRAACDLLQRAGHDAIRVAQQELAGAADARVSRLCQDEQRALIRATTSMATGSPSTGPSCRLWFPIDNARDALRATYPFHPAVLPVFERKWQGLPRFQQTQGASAFSRFG